MSQPRPARDPEFIRMLAEAQELPSGPAKIARYEFLIGHAIAASQELGFEMRLWCAFECVAGGEPAKAFAALPWLLGEFDREPARYRPLQTRLLRLYQPVITSMIEFPEEPLSSVQAWLEDMERRWDGHSQRPIFGLRHRLAAHLGDREGAEQWYGRWVAEPRDELSDCLGCDAAGRVSWLVGTGRDEEAVALAQSVLSEASGCPAQPQALLTALLPAYVRTGRLDRARDAHRHAYRGHRTSLADLASVAEHIRFCALTGNEPRGRELLERHLSWLDSPPTPYAEMRFAAAAARLSGRTDLADRALGIAARFDTRNGTATQSDRVRDLLAEPRVVSRLPLPQPGSRTGRDARALASEAAALLEQDRPLDAADAAEDGLLVAGDDDPRVRTVLADAYERLGYAQAAIAQLVAVARHQEREAPLQIGRTHERIAGLLDGLGREAAAAERYAEAALAYGAVGDVLRQAAASRRYATSEVWAERPDWGLEALLSIERILDGLDPDALPVIQERARFDYDAARLLRACGRLAEADARAAAAAARFRGIGLTDEADHAEKRCDHPLPWPAA